jgi:hypothetical protein
MSDRIIMQKESRRGVKSDKYSMAFTVGGLFLRESARIADRYFGLRDWKRVRDAVLKDNLLQLRTKSSAMRISRELCSRLSCLTETELRIVIEGSSQEQSALLWLAVCRQYRFVYEFASEIIREKFLSYQCELAFAEFDAFFNSKAAWHAELDGIKESTQIKLRQVLFRIMNEAGLLSQENMIQPMPLSRRVVQAIVQRSGADLSVFPAAEADIKELMQ